jgi:hypothetical protein
MNIVCEESGEAPVEAAAPAPVAHRLTNKQDHAESLNAWIGRDMNDPRSCLPIIMLITAR